MLFIFVDGYVSDDGCFGIDFDKFSAEFSFSDEALFLLAIMFS